MSTKNESKSDTIKIIALCITTCLAAMGGTWGVSQTVHIQNLQGYYETSTYREETNTKRLDSHENHIMTGVTERADIRESLAVLPSIQEDVASLTDMVLDLWRISSVE